MLLDKTTFVIGAGASADLGFPVGSGLTTQIAGAVDILYKNQVGMTLANPLIADAARASIGSGVSTGGSFLEEAQQLRSAMPLAQSIDQFLDVHKDNTRLIILAKVCIAHCILVAEAKSSLAVKPNSSLRSVDYAKVGSKWHFDLWNALSSGLSGPETLFDNAVFVIFNYDRCIEQFLFGALQKYFLKDQDQASTIMAKARIYHPYGDVGAMSFGPHGFSRFGESTDAHRLYTLSTSIKTFTERVDETQGLQYMRADVASSKRVIFLGFGYHQQNMNLIAPGAKTSIDHVYGTCAGLSQLSIGDTSRRILDCLTRTPDGRDDGSLRTIPGSDINVNLLSDRCEKLFYEYGRVISC